MHIIHKTLVVGCGDIGKRVGKTLLHNGCQVYALSHRQESQLILQKMGFNVIDANLDNCASLSAINHDFDSIFYFAPPSSQGTTDPRIKSFLECYLQHHPTKRILYISTTGIYGNHNEAWIDESTAVAPDNDRSRRRLDAEQQIQKYAQLTAMEHIIIRVAGIYCLEKLPLDRLQTGMKVLNRKLSTASNRIHADDLCQICIKAMFDAPSGEIFNAADGHPSTMSDYFIETAKIFNLPIPQEVDWDYAKTHFSPGMLSYLNESKKIKSEKIEKLLQRKLAYPTLEMGLKQCLEQFNNENHINL